MEMTVQGQQIDIGDALREHVEGKLVEIDSKYFNNATNANVTFSREGHGTSQFKVNISFHVGKNIRVITEAVEGDPYAAFEIASDKAAKRMRRYKKKFRDHHSRTEKTPEAEMMKAKAYTLVQSVQEASEQDNDEDSAQDPAIIAEIQTHIETMSVSEAVMRMELSDQNAMMFRNGGNNKLAMVYLRKDGNIGWLEPDDQ